MKTILKQVPDEDVYIDFENYFDFTTSWGQDVAIIGNRDFVEYGDEEILSILCQEYEDEELGTEYDSLDELKKITGKEWHYQVIRGYSQGEWQKIFYTDNIKQETINVFEAFYFGKIKEFVDEKEGVIYYVQDRTTWKGHEAICKELDLNPKKTQIMVISGSHKVYDYEPIDN